MLAYYSTLNKWHVKFTKRQRTRIIITFVILTAILLTLQTYLPPPYNSLVMLSSLMMDILALGFISKRKAEFEEFFITYDLQLARNKNYQFEMTVVGTNDTYFTSLKTVILYIRRDFNPEKIINLIEATYDCYKSESFSAFRVSCTTFDEATTLMMGLKSEIKQLIQSKSIKLT